jgi:hypothetical protein
MESQRHDKEKSEGVSRGLKPDPWAIRDVRTEFRNYVKARAEARAKQTQIPCRNDNKGAKAGRGVAVVGRIWYLDWFVKER